MEISFFNYLSEGFEQCFPDLDDLQTFVVSELDDLDLFFSFD